MATPVDGVCPKQTVQFLFGEHPEKGVAVELKTTTTPETAHDAKERFEKQIDSCVFGDDKFKKIVFTTGFRVQSPHHSVVLQVDYVLFVVVDSIRIINCLLIAFSHRDRIIYDAILDDYTESAASEANIRCWC